MMIGISNATKRSILADELERRLTERQARHTAVIATGFLVIMLVMSMETETPVDEAPAQPAAAAGAAPANAYFPSQYTLDAPDRVPAQIATF